MQRHARATDTGGRRHGRDLRGRIARSVAAMFLGALGAVLLIGSAGFLFLAMLHPAGSQGWLTAMFCTAVTGGPGAFAFGHACRLNLQPQDILLLRQPSRVSRFGRLNETDCDLLALRKHFQRTIEKRKLIVGAPHIALDVGPDR